MKYSHHNNRFIFAALLAVALIAGTFTASAQEKAARKHGTILEQIENSNLRKHHETIVDELLDYAFTFKGTRYRSGSSSPAGFDCSGFTSYVFKKFGVQLSRSSHTQINDGRKVSRDEIKPGDLVFFNGRARGRRIGHVGIVTSVEDDGDFRFIHSASGKGISVSNSTEPYYRARYMGACRVIE